MHTSSARASSKCLANPQSSHEPSQHQKTYLPSHRQKQGDTGHRKLKRHPPPGTEWIRPAPYRQHCACRRPDTRTRRACLRHSTKRWHDKLRGDPDRSLKTLHQDDASSIQNTPSETLQGHQANQDSPRVKDGARICRSKIWDLQTSMPAEPPSSHHARLVPATETQKPAGD